MTKNVNIYIYDLSSEQNYFPGSNQSFLFLNNFDVDEGSLSSEDEIISYKSFSSVLLCEPSKKCQRCLQKYCSYRKGKSKRSLHSQKKPPNLCNIKELKNRHNGRVKQSHNIEFGTSQNISDKYKKYTHSDSGHPSSVGSEDEQSVTSVFSCSSSSKVDDTNSPDKLNYRSSVTSDHSLESVATNNTVSNERLHLIPEENRFTEKRNKTEDSVKDLVVSVKKMSEHNTAPSVVLSEKQGAEVGNLSKKRCMFPVKRTKARPLPMLDDDDEVPRPPPRRKSTNAVTTMATKHKQGNLPTSRKFNSKASSATCRKERSLSTSSVAEANQYLVIQDHFGQPLEQSTCVVLAEVDDDTMSYSPDQPTAHSDTYPTNPTHPTNRPHSEISGGRRDLEDNSLLAPANISPVVGKEVIMGLRERNFNQEILLHKESSNKNSPLESGIIVRDSIQNQQSNFSDVMSNNAQFTQDMKSCTSTELPDAALISYHLSELVKNKEKDEKIKLRNNGIYAGRVHEYEKSDFIISDFDTNHVVDLLALVNISRDFLGCLNDSFGAFVTKVKDCKSDRQALLTFLGDKTNLSFLDACQEMLTNCHLENVATLQFEDIQLSLKALGDLLKYLERFINSKTLDERRLAVATSSLSANGIYNFLKTFIKFKGYGDTMSSTEFSLLYQNVVTHQLGMSFPSGNFKTPTKPTPVPPPVPAPASALLYPNSHQIPTRLPRTQSGGPSLVKEGHCVNTPPLPDQRRTDVSKSDFPASNLNNTDTPNNNSSGNNTSKLPFALGKEDLEKLVNNFSFLEGEPRQAIRDYIKVLGTNEPEYAASLLRRIDCREDS